MLRLTPMNDRQPCYFRVLNRDFRLTKAEENERLRRRCRATAVKWETHRVGEGPVLAKHPWKEDMICLPPFPGFHLVDWENMEVTVYDKEPDPVPERDILIRFEEPLLDRPPMYNREDDARRVQELARKLNDLKHFASKPRQRK